MTAAGHCARTLVERVGTSPSPQEVVDSLVPEVADLVLMFVRDQDRLRLVAFRHIDPEQEPVLEQLATVHRPSIDHPLDPVAHVVRTGQGRLSNWIRRDKVEQMTADARVHAIFDVIQPRSLVVVPLSVEDNCYGALVIAFSNSRREFIEGDLDLMSEFATGVAPLLRHS